MKVATFRVFFAHEQRGTYSHWERDIGPASERALAQSIFTNLLTWMSEQPNANPVVYRVEFEPPKEVDA